MAKKKEQDSLKQLEELLSADAKAGTDEDSYNRQGFFISKKDLTGTVVRFSASLILILILYLLGVLNTLKIALAALMGIALIEIFRLSRTRRKESS